MTRTAQRPSGGNIAMLVCPTRLPCDGMQFLRDGPRSRCDGRVREQDKVTVTRTSMFATGESSFSTNLRLMHVKRYIHCHPAHLRCLESSDSPACIAISWGIFEVWATSGVSLRHHRIRKRGRTISEAAHRTVGCTSRGMVTCSNSKSCGPDMCSKELHKCSASLQCIKVVYDGGLGTAE